MNLTDLTAELEQHAAEVPPAQYSPGPGAARLISVRRRIRDRRRRQAASAAGFTAICVAAIVLTPGLSAIRADREPAPPAVSTPRPSGSEELRSTMSPVPSVSAKPRRTGEDEFEPPTFDPDQAGDPLISTATSEFGGKEAVTRFTPTDTNIKVEAFCRHPGAGVGRPAGTHTEMTAVLSINGHQLSRRNCVLDDGPSEEVFSYRLDPVANRAAWARLGVVPGKESVLRMRVDPGKHAIARRLQVGVGVYELSGERVFSDGMTIKKDFEMYGGDRYVLTEYRTLPASAHQGRLSLALPATDRPQLLIAQSPGDRVPATHYTPVSISLDNGSSSSSGIMKLANGEGDVAAHQAVARMGKGKTGRLMIACYTKVN